jgi:hypothetical protein
MQMPLSPFLFSLQKNNRFSVCLCRFHPKTNRVLLDFVPSVVSQVRRANFVTLNTTEDVDVV